MLRYKRALKRLSVFFIALALLASSPGNIIVPVPGYGPGSGAVFASAEYASEEVYLTVINTSSVRIYWPEYMSSSFAYVLQVKVDEGNFASVAEFSRTVTSYEYSGIRASSVYVFRVMLREYWSDRETAYYNEIVYKPAGSGMAPSNPSFTQVSPTETRLSWAYAEGAAYETVIERLAEGESDFSYVATVPAGTYIYTDTNIAPNTFYRYRIKARYGYAVYSAFVEGSVRSAIETPQITAFYAVSPSSIYLSWTASSEAARYQLERKIKGDALYTIVTSTLYDQTDFTDGGIIPGERYTYRVKAISQNRSESLYSDEVDVTALYIDVAQVISAVATGDYSVELSWADLGDKESSYEIWRFDEQSPGWKLLDTTPRNTTGYTDTRVGPGEKYRYKVRARSAVYDSVSQYSAEAFADTIFIKAPSGLKQTRLSATSITLIWKDNSNNESRFIIERRNGFAGQWAQVTSVAANETEKTGLPASSNTAWFFRVGAYSSDHHSVAYSEPLRADNGFETTFRGSSYRTDAADVRGLASGAGSGASSGGGSGSGAGASNQLGELRLNSDAFETLKRYGVTDVSGGVVAGGGDTVTRGEFTAMLARALKLGGTPAGSFEDVKQGHQYYKEIMLAAKYGFASPGADGLFYPDRLITRAEMASFVYDSLLSNGTPLPPHGASALRPFPDAADVPAGLLAQVRAVFGERIMIGIGVSSSRIIGIDQNSTREQAALVIYRYIKWVESSGG